MSSYMVKLGWIATVTTGLSACSSATSNIAPDTIDDIEITHSTFAEVSEDVFPTPPIGCNPSPCIATLTDIDENSVSFAAGIDPHSETRFIAMTGWSIDHANLHPIQQSASYVGQYSLRAIENISTEETTENVFDLLGTPTAETQDITVIANFANSSLSATTATLSIDATFEGNTIDGSVTYKGADGTISGNLFAEQLIAGFHGATRDIVYAGGVIAYPEP